MPAPVDCEILPLERAHALHADFYGDPAWLSVDREAVLRCGWQYVGHAASIPETGDHIVADVAGRPVVVVRNRAGELRAFLNICRHRGGPLATCSGKGLKRFRCAYHGWIYDLDGRLKVTPEMSRAESFDLSEYGLFPVRADVWQGLIFVTLDDATPPLDAVLAGIGDRIAPVDLSGFRFAERIPYPVASNWKVYIDNYLEGYHVPVLHPDLNKVVDYRNYEIELGDWWSLQTSPLGDSGGAYGQGEVFYYFIYPNTMLNITPGRLQTNRVLPDGPDRCVVEFDFYYADDAARARAEADRAFSDQVQVEDETICAHVQRGLESGVYKTGRLCPDRESAVWHWHNLLRRAYAPHVAGG